MNVAFRIPIFAYLSCDLSLSNLSNSLPYFMMDGYTFHSMVLWVKIFVAERMT